MKPVFRKLLDYASRHVTQRDVVDFCPGDPGYSDYVREFAAILSSGIPPAASHFDINETIGLTRWADADRTEDPIRFRWFRTFANSVGVAIMAGPEGPNENLPPNYFAISLLDDAWALQDAGLLQLLPPVFAGLHERVVDTEWFGDEAPFFLLAQLVLAFLGFSPGSDAASLCEQLVAEASKHAGHASPEFLWGCTFFNQLHHRWKCFVELSFPRDAANDSVAALRDALLSSPTSSA